MAETRIIAARTHGRFLVEWGPPERLLVGFHGYGENADESLAQMLRLPGVDQWTVVAVQALHRFYRGRGSGTCAASSPGSRTSHWHMRWPSARSARST